MGVASAPGLISARQYFDRLLELLTRRFGTRLRNPSSILVSGIPIGTVPRTSTDHALLVGDAAAQVKPLSGGGIFTGMRCAQLAADTADAALRAGDVSAARLSEYDRSWQGEFSEEFARAQYLRRLFVRLDDDDFERVIEALRGAGISEAIVAFGDIDFPSHLARRLLRQSPSLVRLFPKALGALVGGGRSRAPELDFDRRAAA